MEIQLITNTNYNTIKTTLIDFKKVTEKSYKTNILITTLNKTNNNTTILTSKSNNTTCLNNNNNTKIQILLFRISNIHIPLIIQTTLTFSKIKPTIKIIQILNKRRSILYSNNKITARKLKKRKRKKKTMQIVMMRSQNLPKILKFLKQKFKSPQIRFRKIEIINTLLGEMFRMALNRIKNKAEFFQL